MSAAQFNSPLSLLVGLQVAVSASSLVVEIVAGRMLAPYVGMSLYTWTSVIAVVLIGFSVGHWWGGRVAEREQSNALVYTGWVVLAAAVTTAGAVLALRLIAGRLLETIGDPVWEIVVLTFSVFFLPSLFAGVPAPVLAQIAVSDKQHGSGRALGTMFAAGAIGAIAGTLLAGFVFIPWLGTALTLAVVTITYASVGLLLIVLGNGLSRIGQVTAIAFFSVALCVVSALQTSPCTRESQYFCIRVIDVSANPEAPVRRLVLDHLSHGTSARDVPRVMFSEFTAMLDAIARGRMKGRQFSAFFIGGGTYSVPRAWEDRNTGPITVAEIDPQVTDIAINDFWLAPKSMKILHEDARRALQMRPQERFDVIVGDAFSDIAIPVHLITKEFFELVADRLEDDGVFLMNVIDFPERMYALASIFNTLKVVFPEVEIWTKASRPEQNEQRVFVLVAGKQTTGFSSVVVPAPDLTRFSALDEAFHREILSHRNDTVLTDDYAPIDRFLNQSWLAGN
ncbi:MAG: fused MFS/spermidine synthase [Thiogranum sp.]